MTWGFQHDIIVLWIWTYLVVEFQRKKETNKKREKEK
jgi:hypothetical protein